MASTICGISNGVDAANLLAQASVSTAFSWLPMTIARVFWYVSISALPFTSQSKLAFIAILPATAVRAPLRLNKLSRKLREALSAVLIRGVNASFRII